MIFVNVLEEPGICEVCGKRVRFIHVLNDKGREVRAGALCAQRLCGGSLDRNRASRRSRWLRRQWSIVPKTEYVKIGRTMISVTEDHERHGWFRFYVNGEGSRRHYPSREAAKLAAFEIA